MSGRTFWAWFKHGMEDIHSTELLSAASNGIISSTSEQDVQIDSSFNPEIMCNIVVGLPILYIFGYCHQLHPVSMFPR